MSHLKAHVSHDYDPSLVYHTHSSNLPHLESWVDELVRLTESSYPKTQTPSTDDLVQALLRYDAVFKELLRQTSIFSEPVTKMMSKAWSGVLKLLNYMVKSYHRYVKHTSHLQTQAHNLLNDRQRKEAAAKIEKEEADLERTALRARIRSLESELESVKVTHNGLTGENRKMRRIINVYIQSMDLNDPAWDVVEDEEVLEGRKKKGHSDYVDETGLTDKQQFGFQKGVKVDAGAIQLRNLNRLDVEMNEILANVLKEENRQRLLMASILKLLDKNRHEFFTSEERAGEDFWHSIVKHGGQGGHGGHGHVQGRGSTPVRTTPKGNVGAGVGGGAGTGAVSGGAGGAVAGGVGAGGVAGAGAGISVSAESVSSKHPHIGLARSQSVAASLAASTFRVRAGDNGRVDVGVQCDEKDEFGIIEEEPKEIAEVDVQTLGVAPLVPAHVFVPGEDQPYLLRRRMSQFPKLLRIPPVVWTCTNIMNIYLDKLQNDEERAAKGLRRQNMADHMYDYFLRISGLRATADVYVAQLVRACDTHSRGRQLRIALFASQVGLSDLEAEPTLDLRDTDFILSILSRLLGHGELVPDLFKNIKSKIPRTSVVLRPDIVRIAAVHVMQDTFEKWLPDGGEDFVMKVKSMPSTEKGFRYVDVDSLIELMLDPWHTVRRGWEAHAHHLYHEYCGVHRVLQEALFASDDGGECSDTVLVEMAKGSCVDCLRRPLRLFQYTEKKAGTLGGQGQGAGQGGQGGGGGQGGDRTTKPDTTSKEPVCEVMNRKQFLQCMHAINPSITTSQAMNWFQEAVDQAHERVLRILERMWMRFLDDSSHYHTKMSAPTQATRSYATPGEGSGMGRLGMGLLGGNRGREGGSRRELLERANSTKRQGQGEQGSGTGELEDIDDISEKRRVTGPDRAYYVNMRTQHSQWVRPYLKRIFRAQDIELSTFVDIVLQKDVLANSPLLEHINHLPPKDLWPNADGFYKQLRDRHRRDAKDTKERPALGLGGAVPGGQGAGIGQGGQGWNQDGGGKFGLGLGLGLGLGVDTLAAGEVPTWGDPADLPRSGSTPPAFGKSVKRKKSSANADAGGSGSGEASRHDSVGDMSEHSLSSDAFSPTGTSPMGLPNMAKVKLMANRILAKGAKGKEGRVKEGGRSRSSKTKKIAPTSPKNANQGGQAGQGSGRGEVPMSPPPKISSPLPQLSPMGMGSPGPSSASTPVR